MINGLLLFGSSLKTKNLKKISISLLLIYAICSADWSNNTLFQIVNIIILLIIPVSIQKMSKYNDILSIFSILIYSVVIDIFCYFIYQVWIYDMNLLTYIYQGLIFNMKGIVLPIILNSAIILIKRGFKYENPIISTR